MNNSKIIRTTSIVNRDLLVDKWYFTSKGRPVTEEMLKHVTVQKYLNKNYLELVDIVSESSIKSTTISQPVSSEPQVVVSDKGKKPDEVKEAVVSTVTEQPSVTAEATDNVITMDGTSSDTGVNVDNSAVILNTDPSDPRVKVFMNAEESLELDLKKLHEDLDKIAKTEEIIVPEKKN